METNAVMSYEGNDFAFELDVNKMKINATEMAKPFGESKQPIQWLRTEASKEYVAALCELHKCSTADLLEVRQGGIPQKQGTWMHEDLAIEFARWLNPKFGIWCNYKIKELLTKGKVELQPELPESWLSDLLSMSEKHIIARRLWERKVSAKRITKILKVSEQSLVTWQKNEGWTQLRTDGFAMIRTVDREKIELPKEIYMSLLGASPRNIREQLFKQLDIFVEDLNTKYIGQ